jgi:hypothetical protein
VVFTLPEPLSSTVSRTSVFKVPGTVRADILSTGKIMGAEGNTALTENGHVTLTSYNQHQTRVTPNPDSCRTINSIITRLNLSRYGMSLNYMRESEIQCRWMWDFKQAYSRWRVWRQPASSLNVVYYKSCLINFSSLLCMFATSITQSAVYTQPKQNSRRRRPVILISAQTIISTISKYTHWQAYICC